MGIPAVTGANTHDAGVLFVCTGNQCRSPMAAALLGARLDERHVSLRVASAGLLSEGMPPPREVVDVMWTVGVDLSGHRSRLVSPEMLRAAALVVGMTRQHLVELTVMVPAVWERTFTLSELIHRATGVGGRRQDESVQHWVGRVQAGRTRAGVLALPLSDDIADPMGGRLKAYERTREQLSALSDQLANLLIPA
jgi:protein-tyrosine phosphatase